MNTFVAGPVHVSVPATSANLGPGFDSLGLALRWRDHLSAAVAPAGLVVDVRGEGAAGVPRDESHLVVRAMRAAFDLLGDQPPGLSLSCDNVIPHARGLGSSSAAIVAGIGLARALVVDGEERLPDAAALQLAAEIEGHPDNVAPALLGGCVVSGDQEGAFYAARAPVHPDLAAVVFVPADPVETRVARGLLPASVPHADAAANAGRAALLVLALGGHTDLMLAATRDWLHQDYRESAMPASLALLRRLRADDVPAVVSGAGPTVLAFACAHGTDDLLDRCPDGWTARALGIDADGLRIE